MSTNNKRLVNIDNRTWTPEDVHYWINPEDGTVNAVIMFDGKKTRLRAGILILNNKDEILMTHEGGEADGELSLPGGGLEIDETPKAAGEREAQEEVHMDTKNLIDTGFDYCEVYDEVKQWVKDHVPEEEWWYNYYTCLILGRYDGEYEGKVAKVDEDPHVLNSARWCKLEDVIHNHTFKEQWKKAILKYVPELRDRLKEAITESLKTPLTEDTRNQLVAKSRTAGPYKNQERGKNRFERKKFSKIATQVKSYNQIDMDQFFKQDILEMTIPVTGETNNYDVVIKINGVLEEIRRNIKANKNTFEYRTVLQALTKMFNTSNIYVKCSCQDFCLHQDTKIKLLNGTTVTVKELEHIVKASNIPIYLYSVDDNGDFKPGKIKDVWVSGGVNKMVKVTLDNGNSILTTEDHPYLLRNGKYANAKDLKVGQSLMPLYFGKTINGYETVKANSMATTAFYSTYKQVAEALLQDEIQAAKIRSGEDRIAIHHKDFNKANNSPENLLPMGVQEHYKYHYEHVFDSGAFDKFKAAGEDYRKRVMDHSTEEYAKQAKVMSDAIKKYWADLPEEEKEERLRKRGEITKAAWKNGAYNTEKRRAADEQRKSSLASPEMRQKAKLGVKQYWAGLSSEEREQAINSRLANLAKSKGWNKGISLSDEDKLHKSLAALNRPQELKDEQNRKIRDKKVLKVFNKLLYDNQELTLENYEVYRDLYFTNSPHLLTVFSSFEDAIKYFGLNHKITKIETVEYDFLQPVYDIAVEQYHNFYVDAGVILHNCYNFDHWSIVNQYSANDSASDPGPGKGIANPNDDKGIGCKHILLALANAGWIMHVASVINNYIHYAENNMQKAFLALIFPKLYDIPASAAVEQGLVPEDTKIETTKDIIDVINKYGKDRGKIKPGTNTNPVTGTGPTTKFPEKEKKESEKEKPEEKKPAEQKPEEKNPSAKPAEKDKEKPTDDTAEKAS